MNIQPNIRKFKLQHVQNKNLSDFQINLDSGRIYLSLGDPLKSKCQKIHIKHSHFLCEALVQTWYGDCNFQKLDKYAEEHRTKSTFLLVMHPFNSVMLPRTGLARWSDEASV